MHAIEIDERDAHHRERAIVQRGFAIGELVVGGKRIAVEERERGLRAADIGVARVGERVELGVAHHEAEQIEQLAVRRRERVAGCGNPLPRRSRSPRSAPGTTQRRGVVVRERGATGSRSLSSVVPSVVAKLRQPIVGAVVELAMNICA